MKERGNMKDKNPKGANSRIDNEVLGTEHKGNRETMKRFDLMAIVQRLKVETRRNQLFVLRRLSNEVDKPFEEMTKDDLRTFLVEVRTFKGREYSESILKTFRINIKKFFKWLQSEKGKKTVPDSVFEWLKPGPKNKNGITADMLLTENDIKRMLEACTSSRDRAIISALYESGARKGELLGLRIGDIMPDDVSAKLMLQGKTGRRSVRLLNAWPYLATYLEDHPDKNNPKAGLWIAFTNNQHKKGSEDRFKESTLRELLDKIAEQSKIGKPIWPHLLRHSRLTHLAIEGYTEVELRIFAGWEKDSRMPSVYCHMTEKNLDDKMLERAGHKKGKEPGESALKPKECVRCGTDNPATNRFCGKCRMPLDFDTATELERGTNQIGDKLDELLGDPKVKEVMKDRAIALGLISQ
jgi:site-specific recombinase XerD